jgi:acetyl-CoA carboxylase biotin carboxyl carrier protein
MDLKDIQELIKFVAKSGATEVDLEIDNVKISIKSPPKKRRGAVDENPIFIQHETTTPQEQVAPIVIPTQAAPPVTKAPDA